MIKNKKQTFAALLATVAAAALQAPTTQAAEGGHGAYLLGLGGPGAGMLPPSGVFFANTTYYYEGSGSASRRIPLNGRVVAGVDAKVFVDLPSLLWVTPWEFLGGKLAFSAALPIGGPSVTAGATLSSPLLARPLSANQSDSIFSVGDPLLSSVIGWSSGNFHWKAGMTGFLPFGDYHKGALANISNNRLALDVNGGISWLDPQIGLELSLTSGVTFNAENGATKYKTGNELHIEWAAIQNFSKSFNAGVFGYHYTQLTGDSGAGATLGAFKGRVSAIGGTIGYNFKLGELPISSRIKFFHEFDVKNRLAGTGGVLSIAMPLYVHNSGNAAPNAVVVK